MDQKANFALAKTISDGKINEILCKDLKVGHIVKVLKEERFPADMILLSSSEPLGIAYLETSNVDGENNLKIRMSHQRTAQPLNSSNLSF